MNNHGCYKCVEPGMYPWPCDSKPNRKIEIFDDDVLTKIEDEENMWMKHTGLGCFGIIIPEDSMVLWDEEPKLTL